MSDNIFIEPICKICGKKFKTLDPIGFHIKKYHNLTIKEYYDKFYKKDNEGFCKTCGKPTNFFKLRFGYQRFCSSTCASRNKEWLLNRENTCINKYGEKNYAATKEGKEKIKQTNLEKYGVTCTLNTKENLNKRKETWLKNLGVDNPAKSKDVLKKIQLTCLNKYGAKNYSQSDEFKINYNEYLEKAKETTLNKYGVENISQSHEYRSKICKKYQYNNINFDSSWEIAYYIWLKDNNIDFEYQPNIKINYTFNGKIFRYFPDFKVNNELIEIKSDYLFNKMLIENTKANAKFNCMKENNIKILFYKDIKPYLEYVKSKYGNNYLIQFKK